MKFNKFLNEIIKFNKADIKKGLSKLSLQKKSKYNLYRGKRLFQTLYDEDKANELIKLYKDRDNVNLTLKIE